MPVIPNRRARVALVGLSVPREKSRSREGALLFAFELQGVPGVAPPDVAPSVLLEEVAGLGKLFFHGLPSFPGEELDRFTGTNVEVGDLADRGCGARAVGVDNGSHYIPHPWCLPGDRVSEETPRSGACRFERELQPITGGLGR